MSRIILFLLAFVSLAHGAQACVSPGEVVDDPRDYVERFYTCPSLASVRDLALPAELAGLWDRAEQKGLIDQPFTIMGNDHDITDLNVVEHALDAYNPHSIELTVRASFRNFGEAQIVDWVFQDDMNDDVPMLLIDVRGVSPYAYSMGEILRDLAP